MRERPKQQVDFSVLDAEGNILRRGRCQRRKVADQVKREGEVAIEGKAPDDRLFRVVDGKLVRKQTDEEIEAYAEWKRARQQEQLRLIERRHSLKHAIARGELDHLSERQLLRILAWILATDEPEATLDDDILKPQPEPEPVLEPEPAPGPDPRRGP